MTENLAKSICELGVFTDAAAKEAAYVPESPVI